MSKVLFLRYFVINYVLIFMSMYIMLSEKFLLSENTMISSVR